MATTKTKTDPRAFLLVDTDISESIEKALFGAAHMQGMMFRSMLKFNLEATQFLQHRLEEDLKTAETFSKCTSFTELNDATTEFCGRAMDEYGKEATKLSSLGYGLATKTAEAVQAEALKATVQ